METPTTSTRRITRSQSKAAAAAAAASSASANSGNKFMAEIKSLSSSKYSRKDRSSALLDISNDSPVLGLAIGSCLKKSGRPSRGRGCGRRFKEIGNPGSGEKLLRDQVKILLKKVEEEEQQQQFLGHFLGFKQISVTSPVLHVHQHRSSIKKNLFL